jgi:hypothetical protein
MSDELPPKNRRFWQLHLSTAVASLLLLGPLIWFNVLPNDEPLLVNEAKIAEIDPLFTSLKSYRGWPIRFNQSFSISTTSNGRITCGCGTTLRIVPFAENILICGTLIIAFAISIEWLIRRREARKP